MRALKVFICIIFIFEINMLWAQDIVKKPSLNLNEVEKIFKGKRTVDDLFRILPVYEEWVKRFPDSYEANWKASRIYCEIGNSVSVNRKSKWHKKYGKLAMKHAKRAIEIDPDGKEALVFYLWGIGEYGMGVSIITAFFMGLGGKFHRSVNKLRELDETYRNGAPIISLARYYFVAPWPVRSLKKSGNYFKKALEMAPRSVRLKVYYGEYLIKKKQNKECKKILKEAITTSPIFEYEGDSDYWKAIAKKMLNENCEKMIEEIEEEEEEQIEKIKVTQNENDKSENKLQEPSTNDKISSKNQIQNSK